MDELKEQLHSEHKLQLKRLGEEADERRKTEVATVKGVLERERATDIAALELKLASKQQLKLREAEERLREDYRVKYEREMASEKERLEQTHRLHLDALTAGITEDNQQQYQLQLEHIRASHEKDLHSWKAQYEVTLKEKLEMVGEDSQREMTEARRSFEQELSRKVAQTEQDLARSFELRLSATNQEWEERMSKALETCQSELTDKYEREIEALKSEHSEETENALQACRKALEDQIEALKLENERVLAESLTKRETYLETQHSEQMEALRRQLLEKLESERVLEGQKWQEESERKRSEVGQLQRACEGLKQQELASQAALEVLREKVGELENENESVCQTHKLEIDQLRSEKQARLEEASKLHAREIQELKAMQVTELSSLRVNYEGRIASLRDEGTAIEDRERQEGVSALTDLRQQHETEMLAREGEFQEAIAEARTRCEERLHETELTHLQEVNTLNEDLERRLTDCKLESERKLRALTKDHEEEKEELVTRYEKGTRELEVAHSRRITELREELATTAESEGVGFASQLEKELGLQRESLANQYECRLSLQESKLRGEFDIELETQRANLEEQYTDILAQVHTESALKNATKLEEQRVLFASEKKALTEQGSLLESRHSIEIARIMEEHQHTLTSAQEELRSEYEAKLTELEVAMSNERKKQISLLVEKHAWEIAEQEETIRLQLETEHARGMEQVVKQCGREKEEALEALRREMEEEGGRSEEEWEGRVQERMEKLRGQLVMEHMAKFRCVCACVHVCVYA